MVEQRQESAELFAAIAEAMGALRAAAPRPESPRDLLREASMRQAIRAARAEGFQRIAVVCGAWHVPALAELPPAKADTELLKGLAKVKVQATWVPWTYGRLTRASGYGAGIASPGWYHHLWDAGQRALPPAAATTAWLARVARLLREEGMPVSTAHIIEAVRLAEALAALRERPVPGLPEMNEATQAICCFGSEVPLQLIAARLIVSERLGQVPAETPAVPLQQDLQREQRRLRLAPEAAERLLDLDQRNENDLARSHLLHRLALLGIAWGHAEQVTGKSGTFHEVWRLHWQPEFAVAIIEAALWGNTVIDAATAFACDRAVQAPGLAELTHLLNRVLLAELPAALTIVMQALESAAALAGEVVSLLDALPPLAQVLRYGNVRQTDTGMVARVFAQLLTRACIGLPGACASLNDEAAEEMFRKLLAADGAIALQREEEYTAAWRTALARLADQQGLHGLLAGRCCRLLQAAGVFTLEEVTRRMGLAISLAGDPALAGAWVEGFLRGDGLVMLHDEALWGVLDGWVLQLNEEQFTTLLPLLRRTFATFTAPERRQLGERARRAILPEPPRTAAQANFDEAQADDALAAMADLFGL